MLFNREHITTRFAGQIKIKNIPRIKVMEENIIAIACSSIKFKGQMQKLLELKFQEKK